MESVRQLIEKRAYELFLKRNGAHGYHIQDWIQAEKEVMAEMEKKSASEAKVEPKKKEAAPKAEAPAAAPKKAPVPKAEAPKAETPAPAKAEAPAPAKKKVVKKKVSK